MLYFFIVLVMLFVKGDVFHIFIVAEFLLEVPKRKRLMMMMLMMTYANRKLVA